jgi:hypothetical protein
MTRVRSSEAGSACDFSASSVSSSRAGRSAQMIGRSTHFEDVAQCIEPIAPGYLGKLLRQRGNILRRLIRRFLARWRVDFGP